MRTKVNKSTGWILWYSGKFGPNFLRLTYMPGAQHLSIQVVDAFRDVPVETEKQAKEMAKKIIKAFEQAYEIAQIIQPD